MAFLGMKYREDVWFVGGLLLAAVLGIIAGLTLALVFLAVCSFVLFLVWFVVVGLDIILYPRNGRCGVFFAFAIPVFVVSTWVTVVVSVFGVLR